MTMTSDRFAVVTPANHVPGPKQGQWTYAHYAALPDDGQHYEIVHGVLFIAPAPIGAHQDTVGHEPLAKAEGLAVVFNRTDDGSGCSQAPQ